MKGPGSAARFAENPPARFTAVHISPLLDEAVLLVMVASDKAGSENEDSAYTACVLMHK